MLLYVSIFLNVVLILALFHVCSVLTSCRKLNNDAFNVLHDCDNMMKEYQNQIITLMKDNIKKDKIIQRLRIRR